MFCDIDFAYDDESFIRHFIVNCPLEDVGKHVQRISNKSCVSQVFVDIHSDSGEFFEYTL